MFPRKIVEYMEKWINGTKRKPLLLRGARQTGKTSAVRLFAGSMPGYLEVNLEAPGEKAVFERMLPVRDLVSALRLSRGITAPLQESLLFLDEIQMSPSAIRYLRFLQEEVPELPVIASGSLLEVYLSRSGMEFPVGRVEHSFMYPVTFKEYLTASGRSDMLEMINTIPMQEYAVPPIYREYVKYAFLGGMPEIVQARLNGAEAEDLGTLYSSLLISFLDDVPKYASSRMMSDVLRHCLETAPPEVGSRITFVGFGGSSYRSREVGEAFRTLEKAMLIYLLLPTGSTSPPVRLNRRKSPKLLFLDSGLLVHSLGTQWEEMDFEDLNSSFRGALAEQCVGQALLADQMNSMPSLSFWARSKRGSNSEVDFMIQHRGKLVPIEVKSGATGKLRSLHRFVEDSDQELTVRFYGGKVQIDNLRTPSGKEFRLLNLPHFLASELPRYLDWIIDQ